MGWFQSLCAKLLAFDPQVSCSQGQTSLLSESSERGAPSFPGSVGGLGLVSDHALPLLGTALKTESRWEELLVTNEVGLGFLLSLGAPGAPEGPGWKVQQNIQTMVGVGMKPL